MTTPIARAASTRVQEVGQDIELLRRIVDGLCGVLSSTPTQQSAAQKDTHNIWKSPRDYKGIEPMVRERVLVDLIAGCGELALNPEHERSSQEIWKQKFSNLLDESVITRDLIVADRAMLMRSIVPASKLVHYCLS